MGHGERGYTFVELLFAIGISSMIACAMFYAMRLGDRQIQTTETRMTIQDAAREGLYKMTQELRLTAPDRITFLNGNAGVQFNIPNPSSWVTSSYETDWANSHLISYARGGTGNQVIRTNLTTGETKVIANDVTALSFTGNSAQPTQVSVTMSVQRQLVNGQLMPQSPLQLTGEAEIRNT